LVGIEFESGCNGRFVIFKPAVEVDGIEHGFPGCLIRAFPMEESEFDDAGLSWESDFSNVQNGAVRLVILRFVADLVAFPVDFGLACLVLNSRVDSLLSCDH